MLHPSTQLHVPVTTASHGLLVVEARAMLKKFIVCSPLAAPRTFLRKISFTFLPVTFSVRQVCLAKRMIVDQCEASPDVIYAFNFYDQKASSIATFKDIVASPIPLLYFIRKRLCIKLELYCELTGANVATCRNNQRRLLGFSARLARQSSLFGQICHILQRAHLHACQILVDVGWSPQLHQRSKMFHQICPREDTDCLHGSILCWVKEERV